MRGFRDFAAGVNNPLALLAYFMLWCCWAVVVVTWWIFKYIGLVYWWLFLACVWLGKQTYLLARRGFRAISDGRTPARTTASARQSR